MPHSHRHSSHRKPARPPQNTILNLCVLAAIIVVVIVLYVNGSAYAKRASERNSAVVMINKLREAFQGFFATNSRFPFTPPDEITAQESKGPFIATLVGKDPVTNPESTPYLHEAFAIAPPPPPAEGTAGDWEVRDTWGRLYRICVDLNGDGTVPNPAPGEKPAQVPVLVPGLIMYSSGPDGNFDTWADNVCSWK